MYNIYYAEYKAEQILLLMGINIVVSFAPINKKKLIVFSIENDLI